MIDPETGRPVPDYDLATPMMLIHYFPTGLLGLGLTALMASFMSGMAGNVTAFNTVWTYDIYQSYIAPNRSDNHYLWMGRMSTRLRHRHQHWRPPTWPPNSTTSWTCCNWCSGLSMPRCSPRSCWGCFGGGPPGHGAFFGLLSGTAAAAAPSRTDDFHRLATGKRAIDRLLKGGWLAFGHPLHVYRSEMAQNFWTAICAWSACFLMTIVISLLTRQQKSEEELRGLVYSLTPHVAKDEHLRWYAQPATLAIVVLAATVALNIIFW